MAKPKAESFDPPRLMKRGSLRLIDNDAPPSTPTRRITIKKTNESFDVPEAVFDLLTVITADNVALRQHPGRERRADGKLRALSDQEKVAAMVAGFANELAAVRAELAALPAKLADMQHRPAPRTMTVLRDLEGRVVALKAT